jgi:hypothetical protein
MAGLMHVSLHNIALIKSSYVPGEQAAADRKLCLKELSTNECFGMILSSLIIEKALTLASKRNLQFILFVSSMRVPPD